MYINLWKQRKREIKMRGIEEERKEIKGKRAGIEED